MNPVDHKGNIVGNGHTNSHRVREIALTLGAIAGTICIVLTLTSWMFGIKPLVFTSGSMSPSIETGALGFAKTVDAEALTVGEVVSVTNFSGTRISHRIEQIIPQNEGPVALTLKGDANDQADLEPYLVAEADRILFSVNKAGYVVAWMSGPTGAFLGGMVVCSLLFIAFRRPPEKSEKNTQPTETGDIEPKPQSHGKAKSAVALAAVGLALVSTTHAEGTRAAFLSTATVSGLSFGAAPTINAAPLPPALPRVMCTSFVLALTVKWDPVIGADGYRIIVRDSAGNEASTTDQPGLVYTAFGALNIDTYTVEIHSMKGLAVSAAWTGWIVNRTLVLVSCSSPTSGPTAQGAFRMATPATQPTTSPSSTTPSTTMPSESSLTTAVPETTMIPPTTTTTITPETTTGTITTAAPTTTEPAEIPFGDAVSSGQFVAQTFSTETGNIVKVSDESGAELFRTPIDVPTDLHWLTGTDELWLITKSGVWKVDASSGTWAKSKVTGDLPGEIQMLVSK